MAKKREEFSQKKEKIAREALYICSSPDCYRFTSYSTTEGKSRTIAKGAHILAAGKSGPRPDENKTSEALCSAQNGIWQVALMWFYFAKLS